MEPKRRAGSESLRLAVATGGWRNSSSQPGVTGEPVAPKASLFTTFIARDAKLFTSGCGGSFQRLPSPLVNNFGKAIRLEALPGGSHDCPMSLPCVSPVNFIGLAYATEAPAACPHMRHSSPAQPEMPPSMRICGDVVGNGELRRKGAKDAEYQGVAHDFNPSEMSGFAVGVRFRSSNAEPRKCLILKGWN